MPPQKHVVVLVLGDIGRSPRMQYHAVSLSEMPNTRVSVLGYAGEKCIPQLLEQSNIQLHTFTPIDVHAIFPRSLFALSGPLKVIIQVRTRRSVTEVIDISTVHRDATNHMTTTIQVFQLCWILLACMGTIDVILVQNPPT